ncbi:cytochrome c oxidase subunit II [soil metagenome]
MAAIRVAAEMVIVGCSDGPSFGAPEPRSTQGESILDLWRGSIIAALLVGALVWGLIIWSVLRYRRRDDDVPDQTPENIPIELFYTIIPVLIVAGLFFFTVAVERDVTDTVDDPDLTVEVVGFQWQWQFTYPDEDIVITGEATGYPPELVLPIGETVRFELMAADVNHSFWVPDFLYKRDLIPGVDNEIDVEVTEAGTYTGRCAEFCGLDHYKMNFTVRAVSPDEYDTWVDERQAAAEEASG